MAPRTILLAAALIGATFVNASPRPKPFPLPMALAQTGDVPSCLLDCIVDYSSTASGLACFGDVDPTQTPTEQEQLEIFNCWCQDSSRAGKALDACTAECTDGGAEAWETTCQALEGGLGGGSPIDEETTVTRTQSTTPTSTDEAEETDDFIDVPTETETDAPETTDDAEETDAPIVDDEEPTATDEDEPTTTRIRRPTAPVEAGDDEGSAQQFLPHAGALAAGLLAAVIAL